MALPWYSAVRRCVPLRSCVLSLLTCGLLTAVAPPRAAGATNAPTGVDQIEVHPAFQVERVAAEPVVCDPVDLQFDEQGTAFVVEMGGYPFASEEEAEYPGKVVIIQDSDKDGIYDRRVLFADRFQYANSILPYRGGLLVASPPHLVFLKDTDGDLRADERTILISGFTVGNSQHNYNGLIHGLDNWIYAGNGGNSGAIYWPDRPEERQALAHRDMKFDLVNRRMEFFGRTTTGFCVAIDDWGRIFTTHNTDHINHHVFPNRYVERVPQLSPRDNPDISDHKTGNLDRAYPIGIQVARLNHPEQSGFFSCSCGITFYGGGSFPDEFNGNVFVADSVMNLVHRDVLRPDGPGFLAARGREKIEFFASADRDSRPVNMRVGPDGALYVVDFYRPVIEHPEWIPDELEKDMDLYAGTNQGRIYRITPRGGLPWVRPQFDRKDLPGVVKHLGHRNKWWRDTAQRLLVEWNEAKAIPLLRELAGQSTNALGRLHALWTLRGLSEMTSGERREGALTEELLLAALGDPHAGVRENALILAEAGLGSATERLQAVLRLADDPDARVRMQVALTLGTLPWDSRPQFGLRNEVLNALQTILREDIEHDWSRFAVLTGAGQAPLLSLEGFVVRWMRDETGSSMAGSTGAQAYVQELAELIGANRNEEDVLRCLALAVSDRWRDDAALRLALLNGLESGLQRVRRIDLSGDTRVRVETVLNELQERAEPGLLSRIWAIRQRLNLEFGAEQAEILARAGGLVVDGSVSKEARLAQLALLRFADFDARREVLLGLLDFRQPRELQMAAMSQLVRERDPMVAERLIAMWSGLTRELRVQASDYLIYRSWNHGLLLTALEQETLRMGQLNLDLERRRRLLWSDDEAIRRRAEALFSDAGVVTRAEVLKRMKPGLTLTGDPAKGYVIYTNLCMTCHVIGDLGHAVGPDLTEISRKGAETLMGDILDPNAAVNTEYLGYTIEDDEWEVYSGIIISETEQTVTLRAAGGIDTTISRDRIDTLESSGLSMMPEGLEEGMTHQDLADLISFLQQPR